MVRSRRTQAQRTATTQGSVLDATVACLVERGYSRTTTGDVARRAGVSPGAVLHHFPSKADLMCAAVGHLFAQRNAEFRKAMANLPAGEDRTSASIDLLWEMFSGATFLAWLEVWVGARTDPHLAHAVADLDREFLDASEEIVADLFAEQAAIYAEFSRMALGMVFSMMNGLALSLALPGYAPVDSAELLDAFKSLIRPAFPIDPQGDEP